jgi:hypothetical protein
MVKGGAVVPGGGQGGGRTEEERGMGMIGWQMGGRRGTTLICRVPKNPRQSVTLSCVFVVAYDSFMCAR